MALATFVKISTVTNLSDARYCAGMGVDAIGFRLEEGQPGYVTPTVFHGITEWLAGVALVGEFLGQDAAQITEIAKEYALDYVQIDHADLVPELQTLSAKLILRVQPEQMDANTLESLKSVADQVAFILVEPEADYSQPDLLGTLAASDLPLVIGFDVEEQRLDELKAGFKGIALKGTEEEKPGFKDYDELMDILEALEVED